MENMKRITGARLRLCGASLLALMSPIYASAALAEEAPANADDAVQRNDLAEGSDIIVTGTRANEIAPVTASLDATQPQRSSLAPSSRIPFPQPRTSTKSR